MEKRTDQLLRRLGLLPKDAGYWYLAAALAITLHEPQALTYLTRDVYLAVATAFRVSAGAVESGLRRAVAASWRHDRPLLEAILGEPLPQCPTTGRFLAALTVWLDLQEGS